ncbi:MAG: HAMP domain-containing protein [Desulfobacteraceae bacterium]|nr:HAMP domain-containing protein [Desulfobacteraceae bacterium]
MKQSPGSAPFNNIQIKLMLLLFVFALVPLCIVGILSIGTAEELISRMADNTVRHLVSDRAALLEKWISERKADVHVIAGALDPESIDPRKVETYLDLVRRNYRVYSDISVISPEGEIICSTSRATGPHNPSNSGSEEWFKASLAGKLYLSDIDFDPAKMESFFRISAPLARTNGQPGGVVCATVGTEAILGAILKLSLGKTGECYLVNRNGTFLAHKEPDRILSQNIAQSKSFKNIFSPELRRQTYIDYRGIEVIGASARVAGTDWALVVEQDRDEAFRSADRLRNYMYSAVALTILGVLFSAWLLSLHVVDPIRRLSRAANDLALGDFDRVQLKTVRRDEIGILYDAFAEMALQLHAREHSLEERVTQREAELNETDVRRKETQRAAARSQQLASLGRLAAGVAHEIRTPLTSLKLFVESVETETDISPECKEDFRIAKGQIRRMEATINRFLDFARPQEPVFTDLNIRELIEEALLVMMPKARQQETIVNTRLDSLIPTVRGDRKQLGEAFLNLMVNGLEALGNGGEISVLVRKIDANGDDRREFIRVDVADTGPGIEDKNLARLFDPFFTTKPTGSGLGLAIVGSTIQRHGGSVHVESSIGKGAVFSVFLPVSAEQVDNGTSADS